MSEAIAVSKCSDDMITEYPERENGYTYYRIGRRIGVSYRGGDKYLCLRHVKVNACACADRIRRYRNEYLEELNFVQADPAILSGGVVE